MVHCRWLLNFNRVKWRYQYQLMNRSDHHLANIEIYPSSIITCLCMFVQIYIQKTPTNITGYSCVLPVIMGGKAKKVSFQFMVCYDLRPGFISQFLIAKCTFPQPRPLFSGDMFLKWLRYLYIHLSHHHYSHGEPC